MVEELVDVVANMVFKMYLYFGELFCPAFIFLAASGLGRVQFHVAFCNIHKCEVEARGIAQRYHEKLSNDVIFI